MKKRVNQITVVGETKHRHEADDYLSGPGTAVVVKRGVLRSIVITCPDACGDTLTINLDKRAGPAWRLYRKGSTVSLFPSIWRDTGCRSHFIVWRSQVHWCDFDEELHDKNAALEERVLRQLNEDFVSFVDISEALDEVPWAVLVACRTLVGKSLAEEGVGDLRGTYRRRIASNPLTQQS
jgi:hypothetical protein